MGLMFALLLISGPLALAVLDLSRMKGGHALRVGSNVRPSLTNPADKGSTAHSPGPTGGSYSI